MRHAKKVESFIECFILWHIQPKTTRINEYFSFPCREIYLFTGIIDLREVSKIFGYIRKRSAVFGNVLKPLEKIEMSYVGYGFYVVAVVANHSFGSYTHETLLLPLENKILYVNMTSSVFFSNSNHRHVLRACMHCLIPTLASVFWKTRWHRVNQSRRWLLACRKPLKKMAMLSRIDKCSHLHEYFEIGNHLQNATVGKLW